MTKERRVRAFAWGLSAVVETVAVIAWGSTYLWELSDLSIYQIFPLLGLSAFSLMWSHYIAAAVRQHYQLDKTVLKSYFEVTSTVVLTAILLHPGLLAWQLWQDGLGLPPGSELNYVIPSARWAILFGFTAFTVFLAYEFRRVFSEKSWWRFVQYASDGAMFLIFFHALKLGGALQLGWFRWIWLFYGLTLAASLAYMYAGSTPPKIEKLPKA